MPYLLKHSIYPQGKYLIHFTSHKHAHHSDYMQIIRGKTLCFCLEVAIHKLDAVEKGFAS